MAERARPYMFYDVALTICSVCFRKLAGKIVFQDEKVFLLKVFAKQLPCGGL